MKSKFVFTAVALMALTGAADLPAEGRIIMFRGSTLVGATSACPIRHEGREIVELGRGKYAEWHVAPGRYILTNKTSFVEVSVNPGETRYVRCNTKMGMLVWRADLQIADQANFDALKADLEMKLVETTAASK
jgi:hypothetical protein